MLRMLVHTEAVHCMPTNLSSAISVMVQLVVMAGGTNDFLTAPPDLDEWRSDIINFISTVRQLIFVQTQLTMF